MVYEEVIDLLRRSGAPFQVHEHPPVVSIEEATVRASHLLEGLLKTVVFKVKDAFWVLAAVRYQDRIDYRKLADALEVNRKQLRSLSPEEVEAALGFEIGGVGPIPLNDHVRVVFDSHLEAATMVRFGSGSNTRTIELDFRDLLRVSSGKLFPIVRA